MEIQGLPLLNINNTNKPTPQTRSAGKPSPYGKNQQAAQLAQAEEEPAKSSQMEVLISVSSTVADSNGINLSDSRLAFSVDEGTGDTVINIVDNKTGDTVRQIPPDAILKLKKKMGEIQGLLLDRKV